MESPPSQSGPDGVYDVEKSTRHRSEDGRMPHQAINGVVVIDLNDGGSIKGRSTC
jgi:hypothetical protein